MVARRLSIWGALRQISSMNARNTASKRGDWWAASSSLHQAAAAARKDTCCQQKGSGVQDHPVACSTLCLQPLLSSHPDNVVGMEKDASQSTRADRSREKNDRLFHGLS